MKILHLATVASSHRYLLLAQLTALVEAGHDVLAVSAAGDDVAELERRGIRFRALDASTRGVDISADLRATRSFATIVREERPDLVHTHNPKPGVYGRILSRVLRVPRIVNTVHGLYATPTDPFIRRAAVYGLEAIAARCSHLELVQNIEDVELMMRTPLAPNHKVRHLGNGIDLTRFGTQLDAAERSRLRAELGVSEDAVVVVSVGRLVREKGFGELFEASAAVDAPHELVIIGPDDPEKADRLDATMRSEAEARGVRFLGHRSDVDRILRACDVFVLASYREGMPRSAMEASACGLAVIATDIRGCRQVVDHGRTGLLVPPRQARPLVLAIEELVTDADRRSTYGAAARVKAEAEFDEQLVVERLLAAYAELGLPG